MLDIFLEEGRIIILNSFTKMVFGGLGWSWWLIPLILIAMAGIVAIKIGCDSKKYKWLYIGIVCLFFALAIGFPVASDAGAETYEVYEVTIDDSVPFKDFNEVCEIIDQRGAIYTIRFKEAGD